MSQEYRPRAYAYYMRDLIPYSISSLLEYIQTSYTEISVCDIRNKYLKVSNFTDIDIEYIVVSYLTSLVETYVVDKPDEYVSYLTRYLDMFFDIIYDDDEIIIEIA